MKDQVHFPELFPGYEPPEELQDAVRQLAVARAEIDRDARSIALELESGVYLREEALDAVRGELERRYGLRRLELRLRYPETLLPQMDFCDLARVFIRAFSPSAAILAGARWEVGDETVTIHLQANGKDNILQHAKKAESYIEEHFGSRRTIVVEAHSAL